MYCFALFGILSDSSMGQHDISTLNVTISVALQQRLDGTSQC